MNLSLRQKLHGFTIDRVENLPEIDGTAAVLTHDASGARLLYLKNDDPNKAFCISFKTPPADSTGVFHILEHSVLCGSRKFPVKEPFVNLLKTSMQTFLNAMTFPDKTMYPVASTNEQDLLNLMDVYLDAVLHPAIYEKKNIFEQEGWHYELDADERLSINGVVYNEMKGALSSPDSVLYDALAAALFPDTAYRFESGGDPRFIPELTYEQFLEEHRKHYRLDNSYLTVYGNVDIDRILEFLDERYLGPDAAANKGPAPNPLVEQAPVVASNVEVRMKTAPENAMAGIGYVCGHIRDRKRIVAADILIDALFGSNEAPLKRALLDADIADDVSAFLADSMLQPFVMVQARGTREDSLATMQRVLEERVRTLVEGGIDSDLVEGAIAHAEFVMREHDFGMADGVALAVSSMAGWLYDDDLATSYVRYEDDFRELRQDAKHGYFENLARELFLENNHWASVRLVAAHPDEPDPETERLRAVEQTLDQDARDAIAQDVENLRKAQEAPDAPEDVAKLPRLSRADIGCAPERSAYRIDRTTPVPCIIHDVSTHGIVYTYRYFDIAGLSRDDLPYATILSLLLGKLDTSLHTAAQIDTLVQNQLGTMSFFIETSEDMRDASAFKPLFVVGASALAENTAYASSLPNEVMAKTAFSDFDKIKDVLVQKRTGMEQTFANAGHNAALARATAHLTPAGAFRDMTGGVGFYRFLRALIADFDTRKDELAERLGAVARRIFSPERVTLSFAGPADALDAFWNAGGALDKTASSKTTLSAQADARADRIAPLPAAAEAFVVPCDVVYAARAYDLRTLECPYEGAWGVAARALSYDYLWNEVRVKGGAYGVGFQATRSGAARFYSYRDPRLDETLTRFESAAAWMGAFDADDAEMDGYVVSTVASFDAPQKARELVRRQDSDIFQGFTPADRADLRNSIISVDAQSIRRLAAVIEQINEQGTVCVFGSKSIIENAHADLQVFDLLNEPLPTP